MFKSESLNTPVNRNELARDILSRIDVKGGLEGKKITVSTNENIIGFLLRTGGFAINRREEIIRTAKFHRIIEIEQDGEWVNNIFHEQLTNDELRVLGIDFEEIADEIQKRLGFESVRGFLKRRLSGDNEPAKIW